MTCAACHTSELIINGQSHRIDGGSTDADFIAFIGKLSQALSETAKDSEKFERFAQRVTAESKRLEFPLPDKGNLWVELRNESNEFAEFFGRSRPDPEKAVLGDEKWSTIPGKARLDAFGIIINEVAFNLRPVDGNVKIPSAAVSYPFLWDTDQQSHVQWNGISTGALSRNTTEVLGVFAKFDPHNPKRNTVQLDNLRKLQKLVKHLRSPRWDDPKFGLPAVDSDPIGQERGKALYETHCQRCHQVLVRNEDQVNDVPVTLNPLGEELTSLSELDGQSETIGTDPLMATNFAQRRITIEQGEEEVTVRDALAKLLLKIWSKSFSALLTGVTQALLGAEVKNELVYKARPLNGVWATAPYLHNGSVANMMDLLKPATERAEKFCVGSRVFDPNVLGFESKMENAESCGQNFVLDTKRPGNSNQGHGYGTENDPNVKNGDHQALSHQDRLDIIEFIKAE